MRRSPLLTLLLPLARGGVALWLGGELAPAAASSPLRYRLSLCG